MSRTDPVAVSTVIVGAPRQPGPGAVSHDCHPASLCSNRQPERDTRDGNAAPDVSKVSSQSPIHPAVMADRVGLATANGMVTISLMFDQFTKQSRRLAVLRLKHQRLLKRLLRGRQLPGLDEEPAGLEQNAHVFRL